VGKNNFWSKLYLVCVFLVLYSPIAYLVFYSFNSGGTMHGFDGFTLEWYQEVFQDTRLLIIVLNTLVIALLSSAISTIFGIAGALAIHRIKRYRRKNALLSMNNVLIVSPDVIIGASFLIFHDRRSEARLHLGAAVAHRFQRADRRADDSA